MARIPQISSKDEIPQDKAHIYDAISNSRGRISGPFSVLLHSPEVAGRAAHLGSYIRFESTLPDAERELAIITTAREMDCSYEWYGHERLAREVGVRDEAIDVVLNRKDLDSLTNDEALIVRYGREIIRNHKVSDSTFQAAKEKYGVQGLTELTATFGYYSMLAASLNAFEVQPPPDATPLP